MVNDGKSTVTRLAELVSASPDINKETLKQVQGDELIS